MSTEGNSKYAEKKAKQKAGTYHGTSPFFHVNPEWQYLKPLHMYPHLQAMGMKIPDPNRRPRTKKEDIWDIEG